MEFLTANTKAVLATAPRDPICTPRARTSSSSAAATPAPTASAPPCARAASSLLQIEIMPKPPDERADNPWPEWPKVYKMDYGQEEAAAKFGADPRIYLTTVKKFVGDARPATRNRDRRDQVGEERQGAVHPVGAPGTEKTHPAQLVLLAMGFLGPNRRCSRRSASRRRPQQREGRVRQVRDQREGRLRGRRLPPRAEPRRLGDQRGPWCRARVRPLPDGFDRPAVVSLRVHSWLNRIRVHPCSSVVKISDLWFPRGGLGIVAPGICGEITGSDALQAHPWFLR
jgi:hypothetical protein